MNTFYTSANNPQSTHRDLSHIRAPNSQDFIELANSEDINNLMAKSAGNHDDDTIFDYYIDPHNTTTDSALAISPIMDEVFIDTAPAKLNINDPLSDYDPSNSTNNSNHDTSDTTPLFITSTTDDNTVPFDCTEGYIADPPQYKSDYITLTSDADKMVKIYALNYKNASKQLKQRETVLLHARDKNYIHPLFCVKFKIQYESLFSKELTSLKNSCEGLIQTLKDETELKLTNIMLTCLQEQVTEFSLKQSIAGDENTLQKEVYKHCMNNATQIQRDLVNSKNYFNLVAREAKTQLWLDKTEISYLLTMDNLADEKESTIKTTNESVPPNESVHVPIVPAVPITNNVTTTSKGGRIIFDSKVHCAYCKKYDRQWRNHTSQKCNIKDSTRYGNKDEDRRGYNNSHKRVYDDSYITSSRSGDGGRNRNEKRLKD
jgi:hypothetical protein